MRALLIAGAVVASFTVDAVAQDRRYVMAGSTGTNCTYVAPCPYAFDPTFGPLGGVIKLLGNGDFGLVNTVQPVSLEGSGTGSSIEGLTWTGEAKHVFIRNLSVSSYYGLSFQSPGSLSIVDVGVSPYYGGAPLTTFYNAGGLDFRPTGTATLSIKNVTFENVPAGGRQAIRVTSGGHNLNVSFDNVQVSGGNAGIVVDTSAGGFVRVSIRNSTFANISGSAITATGTGAVRLFIDDITMVNNQKALVANGSNIIGWIGETTIAGNQVGIERTGGANLMSFKNNYIYNNTVNGTPLPQSTTPMGDSLAPQSSPTTAPSPLVTLNR